MRKYFLYLQIFLSVSWTYAQGPLFPTPLSPRLANYHITVNLDTKEKKLSGSERLTWKNNSPDFLKELQFHLYLNGFKNDQSTFLQGPGGRSFSSFLEDENGWGWIKITRITFPDGADLTDSCVFIQPDDHNVYDQTVMKLNLPEPVKPGQVVDLKIEFEAQLPRVVARTGYEGEFFMVGQWFPKIGVYEPAGTRYATKGQWNCHQFHATSEFYADYGNYQVTIRLPEAYIVGATGVKVGDQLNGDGTRSVTYACEDVHDFAWTADTDYIIIEDQWQDVKLYFYAQPLRVYQAGRHLQAAKSALEYLTEWVGPYPYPTLTIVDPQYRAMEASGMEYPTLVTAGTLWLVPSGLKFPEEVTIHEVGHNFFYGIIGSNEFEEAWLDEGITTYMEFKIMEHYYGQGEGTILSMWDLNIDQLQMDWGAYSSLASKDIIFKNSWQYDRGGYGIFSYYKPALMLLTLENYLGEKIMKEIMHKYYDRYKFKHPITRDFIGIVNEVSGQDLNWFFDQVLYGSNALDYGIDKITVREKGTRKGIFNEEPVSEEDTSNAGSGADSASTTSDPDSAKISVSRVIVAREGEVIFPVEVLVKFDNGEEILENWDGKERFKIYKYEQVAKVISAEVDPQRKIWLDRNFLNNGKTVEINPAARYKYSLRWLFWMQNILQYFSIF